jgi:hypothetical protein
VFLFSAVFRPALGPNKPPIQWVLGTLCRDGPVRGVKLSTPSDAEVRNSGAVPLLPDVFMEWCLIN